MDMGIVNPGMIQIYDEIDPELLKKVEAVVLDTSDNASEELLTFAQTIKADDSVVNKSKQVYIEDDYEALTTVDKICKEQGWKKR